MPLNPYTELGIDRKANAAEIKRAYRRRISDVHPDRNPDDPFAHSKTQQATEAYDILSDPVRRRAYDEDGTTIRPMDYDPGARAVCVELLVEAINHGADNLILAVRRGVKGRLEMIRQQQKAGRASQKRIAASKKRFTCKGEKNFLAEALDGLAQKNAEALAALGQTEAVLLKALELSESFEDVKQITSHTSTTSPGGAFFHWSQM